ncbi:PQQ-binding-like beta-propeller repeat protein [Phenylobacterium aquaticum]|uniref:PQQ-binding-like beta-propeller repeat protein n=1 Tax=Phenylobacterium aquaticum TaxID=1763816 RepID=UPI003AFAB05D
MKKKAAWYNSLGKSKTDAKKNVVRPLWSSPILANGRLVLGADTGEIVALNAKTGVVEKSVQVGAPLLIGPIALNGALYFVSDEAQLIALR